MRAHGLPGDQRPHLRALVGADGDLQCARAFGETGDDLVGDIANEHGDRDGHAPLAGRSIRCAHQRIDRLIQVRVRHHDHVVLGAAEGLHPLAAPCAFFIDVFGHRRRAHEADAPNSRIAQDRIHERRIALQDVEQTVGQPRALQQLRHEKRRRRIAFAGLQDESVPCSERERKHPARHHAGKLKGVMPATTPRGWRIVQLSRPFAT